ncbi:MAG: M23 family metallopeptidase, partial [Desulfovibrionaceae bacterium]|nr:M23 family metallopeptidase [Desulfovibrionaceae bacterium]
MRRIPVYLLAFILLGAGGGLAYFLMKDMDGPSIRIAPDNGRTGAKQEITVYMYDEASEVKSVDINIRKNNVSSSLLTHTFDPPLKEAQFSFTLENAKLRDGAFELEIKASDTSMAGFGKGNSTTRLFEMRYDSVPPRLSVRTAPPYIYRGGAGCIAFTANEELAAAGVKVNELFFPAYRQENNEYICFFAFPYNVDIKDYKPVITAQDLAGNIASSRLASYPLARNFRTDTINLSDSFLESKDGEFMQIVPGDMTPLQRYLVVNGDIRRENDARLLELGKQSADSMLWSGTFARLPNASSPAGFAEFRSYIYNGEVVDQQTHQGSDLAAVRQAAIPAANHGVVIYTGYMGIYGEMVLIDHGLGV